MKRISLFITLSFSFLLLSALVISCTQDEVQLEQISEEVIETRSQASCVPEGICQNSQSYSWNFNYLGCDIKVYMKVTECTDGLGNITVYFEETLEIVDILSGSCSVTPSFIEGAYLAAVEIHMEGNYTNSMPDCRSESEPTVSSKQIKINCRKYCYIPVFSAGEYPSYEWLDCANQESCCIVTTEWCLDGEGNAVGTIVSEDTVGDCEGDEESCPFSNVISPYSPGNSNPDCIEDRCE